VREKIVEEKLRCEVLLLETRIAEIHNNIDKQKARIRAAHQKDTHDVATKKSLFLVLKCLTGQSRRYNELLKVCSSMLDHVQEQLLMTETKQVLNKKKNLKKKRVRTFSMQACSTRQMVYT